ncbi:MAG TPA: 4-hydroxybenzoate octaprenyltransferase [Gammaproteobacteria bacterium]|nr:4-hydroxybenzoate octaprenyltransferase [Gammaproteobacteria bacterium]HCK93885.1 4-hydroxybenzoate octaprenyltransferase [Gammaproteobacteria bacterium]|tara:strand:+ start:298 stop:1182 length:885 start_codon:yes stop_codon:yes gene_type:complete
MVVDANRQSTHQPSQGFKAKFHAYMALTRFDKPVGSLLLLWPALWGLLVAAGDNWPSIKLVFIFTIGTFLMRSAGCAINDFADRKIDGSVERTKHRPLAAGLISAKEAVLVAAACAALSFILVLFTNSMTILMSFGGAFFAALYPFTKRWIASPQVFLGFAFAWAIPMGFTAVQSALPIAAWLYFLISILWIVAYDTYYAMADMEYDKDLNIGSTALLFGQYAAQVSLGLNLVFILCFYCLSGLHLAFIAASIVCSLYQYKLAITLKPALCIQAFKLNNLTGLILTLGLIVGKL